MKVLILGHGVRGRTYEQYARAHPGEYEIAAIADPVSPSATVRDWTDALETPADAAIIALPDRLHCAAAKAALAKGLHILLEKPIGCSWAECEEIKAAAARARRLVLTGYVLRFAAYYRRLTEVLRSGVIGELTSIHHLAAISYGKAAHAFCRGNWAREADGTSTLVQKCTHDFDLIAWWARGKACTRMASFGSLMHWRPQNAPAGAAARCTDCPAAVRAACPFDAHRLYCERTDLRYHFPDESDAAMEKVVAESPYGRCVYACGNDAVDHQTVLMEFDGGLTVTLEMESFSARRGRTTHFYGTRGEIAADGETIEIRPFIGAPQTIVPAQCGNHGGGDREIMSAFARLAATASSARYAGILEASLVSHRLAFRAEALRRNG